MSEEPRLHRLHARNNLYQRSLENMLRRWCVDDYPARAEAAWQRDYSSVDAYVTSVEPMRARWKALLAPPDFKPTGDLSSTPTDLVDQEGARWLHLPLGTGPADEIAAEGILTLPTEGKGPFPLVIAQHGLGSFPEKAFGVGDPEVVYHSWGQRMVAAGYAILAPFNLSFTESRNRVQRLAFIAGTTVRGIELARLQRLLDVVLAMPEIDDQRVGMWGLSLGGMATQCFAPIETRIKVAISAAWFNDRPRKMAVPDPRYTAFLESPESYMFIPGWLTAFADEDLLSLMIPRALMLQSGKADGIAWWPDLIPVFERLRDHFARLGLEDRVALDLHEGVHEIRVETGLAFLEKHL